MRTSEPFSPPPTVYCRLRVMTRSSRRGALQDSADCHCVENKIILIILWCKEVPRSKSKYTVLKDLNKLNKQMYLYFHAWLTKVIRQTDLRGHHSFILFNFVYMWRTLQQFLASNYVKSLYYYLIDIVIIKILSLDFFSNATKCHLKHNCEVLININSWLVVMFPVFRTLAI